MKLSVSKSFRGSRIVLAAVLVSGLTLGGWIQSALAGGPVQHVVIVSLDATRSDAVLSADTPNIHEMARNGAFTWWAQTIRPSSTLPSHASMLSGCQPAKHGIIWNGWKPDKGYVKTSTCFELAKAAGLSTAMFVSKQKLQHIAKPGTVDKFLVVSGESPAIALSAGAYFKAEKPGLMFVHFPDADEALHDKGVSSPEYRSAIEQCDKSLGILRVAVSQSGVASSTVFIVTADHGAHLKDHGSPDVRDMTIPWICWGEGLIAPGEIQDPVSTCDTAATAVSLLGLKPADQWDGKSVISAAVSVPEAVPAPVKAVAQ